MSSFPSRTAAATVAAGALGLSAWAAPAALAHDAVIGGTVVEGQVLDEFPESITLEFSGIPREGFNNFAVTDRDTGDILFSAEPKLDGRYLTIEGLGDINPGPGDYQVGFQITSSDGHATRGGVRFSVAGDDADFDAAAEESAIPADEDEVGDAGGPLKWILAVGGVLALAAVVVLVLAKRRLMDEQ